MLSFYSQASKSQKARNPCDSSINCEKFTCKQSQSKPSKWVLVIRNTFTCYLINLLNNQRPRVELNEEFERTWISIIYPIPHIIHSFIHSSAFLKVISLARSEWNVDDDQSTGPDLTTTASLSLRSRSYLAMIGFKVAILKVPLDRSLHALWNENQKIQKLTGNPLNLHKQAYSVFRLETKKYFMKLAWIRLFFQLFIIAIE